MYIQYLGVVGSFFAIIYLSRKGISLAWTMFCAASVMALTSGLGASKTLDLVFRSMKDPTTLNLVAAVMTIGLFSTAMKETSLLEGTVAGLSALLGNVKAALMSVPALIGSLPVTGGAVLSAPLVDRLGDSLTLSPDEKAAANLAFRHGMSFIFPFSPALILTSTITGFPMGKLISWLWPMSLAIWGAGYLTLLRKASPGLSQSAATIDDARGIPTRSWGLITFLKDGSPLLLALGLGVVLGLPIWVCLVTGTALALLLSRAGGQPFPSVKTLVLGSNLNQAVAMLWIMVFQGLAAASPVFPAMIGLATEKGVSRVLVAAVLPLVLGFVSASHSSTIGVFLPILVPQEGTEFVRMAYISLVYSAGFLSYFFSPLHLCQILTNQYFKTDIFSVYRKSLGVLAAFCTVILVYALLLSF